MLPLQRGMNIMKYVILTALAVAMLFISTNQAEETNMKKLDVNLGFSQVPDNYTCKGADISPRIEVRGFECR